jgi:hypothetical protein
VAASKPHTSALRMNSKLQLARILTPLALGAPLWAQDSTPTSAELLLQLQRVENEVAELKAQGQAAALREREATARSQSLLEELDLQKQAKPADMESADAWHKRLTLGGYGEIHFTSVQGAGEVIDIARFVGYLGYRFSDWIQLHSEVEIEGGLVAPDAEGELAIEQLYMDFLLEPGINVRLGRVLTPLGIINQTHEPTTFNGVLRPDFATFIIPTTWVMDGAGIFGNIRDDLKYELYVGSSLDGAEFDAVEGIREGRQEGVPSLSQPAVSGRLDYYAIQSRAQSLRLGLSFFGGGLDNGPGGVNPGIDANIQVYSADCQYSLGDFDFRGVYAFENINGAANIGNNVASEIDGFYVEGAYHFWPERWKSGRLEHSDAIAFVRYDDLDTQKTVPTGVTQDPQGDRNVTTFGLGFFPTSNVVIKTDYQIYDSAADDEGGNRFNIGLGFSF